jgi:hypothetical protein
MPRTCTCSSRSLGSACLDKAGILGGTATVLWFPTEQAEVLQKAREQKERIEHEVILGNEDDGSDELGEDAESSKESAQAAEVINMADLLAAQNYTPIKTDEIGQFDDAVDSEFDASALMDAADQLSAMLGSVEELGNETASILEEAGAEVAESSEDEADDRSATS